MSGPSPSGHAKLLPWGERTYIMGILNITPDSFSSDGLILPAEDDLDAVISASLDRGRKFLSAGADMLDVGGESTRPGASPVPEVLELGRVVPVIKVLAHELEVPISVDTSKAPVALAALNAGAQIVNDVWGLRADPNMAKVIAESGARVVLMHNRSSWAGRAVQEQLKDARIGLPHTRVVEEVINELKELVGEALKAGIQKNKIILDSGLGFGKTMRQNLEILNRLDEIHSLGFPILIGPSRKGFVSRAIGLPIGQHFEGTAAAVAVGVVRGADIVRVHDVQAMARVVRMVDAIIR